MSHILEEYAKNLGVLISKPIISEHFFPCRFDKYITIYCEDKIQSKKYLYFDMVFNLLNKVLKENKIKIIQIDAKDMILENVDLRLSNLTFKQNAYIISKSILHIGVDNVYSHYASSKNIPSINLFGNIYSSVSNGYWNKNKQKNIEAKWSKKPCLNIFDPKSEINTIKPEEIASKILEFISPGRKLNFNTIKIGDKFLNRICEVVPTSFHQLPVNKDALIHLRVDYGFTEEAFMKYCTNYKTWVISDKLIQPAALEKIQNNVNKISFIIDKNSDEIPSRYLDLLKSLNISFEFLIKDEDQLGYFRNKYFDYSVNPYKIKNQKPDNITPSSKFISSKIIYENNIKYPSKAHWLMKNKNIDNSMNVLDNDEYWNELDYFYIYEQN
jgi:hypothetical protein